MLCEYDPDTRGGDPADGRKVKGATIHWVDAATAVDAEVRLYDNLFSDPDPDGGEKNFLDCLNPDSLEVLTGCKVEASLADATALPIASSSCGWATSAPTVRTPPRTHLVFNRAVSLKDGFQGEKVIESDKSSPERIVPRSFFCSLRRTFFRGGFRLVRGLPCRFLSRGFCRCCLLGGVLFLFLELLDFLRRVEHRHSGRSAPSG